MRTAWRSGAGRVEQPFPQHGFLSRAEFAVLTAPRPSWQEMRRIFCSHEAHFGRYNVKVGVGGSGGRRHVNVAGEMLAANTSHSARVATATPLGVPVAAAAASPQRVQELEALVQRLTIANVEKDERLSALQQVVDRGYAQSPR